MENLEGDLDLGDLEGVEVWASFKRDKVPHSRRLLNQMWSLVQKTVQEAVDTLDAEAEEDPEPTGDPNPQREEPRDNDPPGEAGMPGTPTAPMELEEELGDDNDPPMLEDHEEVTVSSTFDQFCSFRGTTAGCCSSREAKASIEPLYLTPSSMCTWDPLTSSRMLATACKVSQSSRPDKAVEGDAGGKRHGRSDILVDGD